MPTIRDASGKTKEFKARQQVKIDFAKLRASGELHTHQLQRLESGYPGAPILFMGKTDIGVVIGIKTGEEVYPKNSFFLSESLVVDAIDPV